MRKTKLQLENEQKEFEQKVREIKKSTYTLVIKFDASKCDYEFESANVLNAVSTCVKSFDGKVKSLLIVIRDSDNNSEAYYSD